MRKSLVAFDTDHIKGYVFGTDKLKEIRGASSLLDRLNRGVMKNVAEEADISAIPIYMNGGSGLFLVDTEEQARQLGQKVQLEYRRQTGRGASITYVLQELPEHVTGNFWKFPIKDELELLRYRLREEKDSSTDRITLPSHPFMRPCDECGVEYAEKKVRDPGEREALYCVSCFEKRREDFKVKDRITEMIERLHKGEELPDEYLWDRILRYLNEAQYTIPPKTERPSDFNEFLRFIKGKEYFGLIYADANNMGKKLDTLETLEEVKNFADSVDDAVYRAMSLAIKQHLPVNEDILLFPFDILLVGGDDIVMVTDAAKAMDVALTIAEKFHELTKEKDPNGEGYNLSVGVVLAPIKYPFRLLRELVESTLKFAKKEGAKPQAHSGQQTSYGSTRINFMTVTGSTSQDFKKVYTSLSRKNMHVTGHENDLDFYATLRPYAPEQLTRLLNLIREGHTLNLGRSKLHQVREAVLKMNLTTSVSEGLAVLRNWRTDQRTFVVEQVFEFGDRYQAQHHDARDPASLFPRVTFPWFADGKDTYRSSLLDFVELYDFAGREEGDNGHES